MARLAARFWHAITRVLDSNSRRRTRLHGRPGPARTGAGSGRRGLAAALSLALGLGLAMAGGAAPAQAAGDAVLSLELTPVDPISGDPVTQISVGQYNDRLGYRVNYSCLVTECTDTTVQFDPTGLDPTYDQFRLLTYATWTAPAGGATISGSDAAGWTVNLGTLAAGTSGSFLIVYQHITDSSYTIVNGPAYFPPGYQIEQSATIASESATGPVTADADTVTWTNTIPDPSVTKTSPGNVDPDTNVTYTLRMGSGCFESGGSGRIRTSGARLCAESYTVVDQLPAQAEYVSSSDGGGYDPDTHTVTWSLSGPNAAGGWGSASTTGWVSRGPYHPRTVTVRYPADNFTEATGGADFIVPVTNQVTTTVTYLDDDETTKTASAAVTHNVARVTPFGRATAGKDSTYDAYSGQYRYVNVPPDVTGLVCPAEGSDDWGRTCTPGEALSPITNSEYWYVDTYNRANVPGVAVVTDNSLDQAGAPVHRIATNPAAASIAWTLNTGETGTASNTSGVNAPAGTWFVAATVTSGELAGPNTTQTDNGGTRFRVSFSYDVETTAPVGEHWVNNATSVMTYPDYPELDDITLSSSRTVIFREQPTVALTPRFAASVVSAVVDGGGQAVPGRDVTFTVRGATSRVPANAAISPQYVFIAPVGWELREGSAAFAPGSVPDGVSFYHHPVTVDGVQRQAVIAHWPEGATFGENVTWPSMTVVATPSYAVVAGTSSVASFWAGDALHTFDSSAADWASAVADSPDVDGDGDTTEPFATATATVTVSAYDLLTVVKEICVPDASAADGCRWVSNPDIVVGVAPSATNITYRVTLQNTGNSTLSDVIAYDVLPYLGDTGTSSSTATTPRGSTFAESLNAVTEASANTSLAFSTSTNPCRAEVYPSAPGCVDSWDAAAGGAQAIRATVSGPLAPGAVATFSYTANVVAGAVADAIACNSVAVDSDRTLPAEPEAVCATTQEADLAITVPSRLPLQAGRPGVVPYTVTNLGDSAEAPASVQVSVPAGVRVTSLAPEGWTCTASATGSDGSIVGPVDLDCTAIGSDGAQRSLAVGVPNPLNIPAVIPEASLIGSDTCFPAEVTGLMSDPDLSNNTTSACFDVLAGGALLGLGKTDGRTAVGVGEEYTYRLTVTNGLVGEDVTDVTITDTLPGGVVFVSASAGGQVADQGAPDAFGNAPGGTVTWNIARLAAAGLVGPDGDRGSGAAGSSVVLTVTVRVVPGATGDVVNRAEAGTADPFRSQATLSAQATDTDGLYRLALAKDADIAASGARPGQTVTYTVTARNTGTADFADAVIIDDLAGLLDDASFVAGSATVSINGAAGRPVPDPTGDRLTWIGTIPAGGTAVLGYQVVTGDPGDGSLVNRAGTHDPLTDCDTATGLDDDGLACATTADTFAPTVDKAVHSLAQQDDGSWTIVYDVDVANPGDATAGYDLADVLRFGAGIDVLDAEVTDAPADVTPEDWDGDGAVVLGASLDPGATHHYELTVVADPHAFAGTPSAACTAGADGGFANLATAALSDGSTVTGEACASPVEPTVAKSLDGDPVQGADGNWRIAWLVTVTNPHELPGGGLGYTLADRFDFPDGVALQQVTVTPPSGVTANPGFTGGLAELGGSAVTPSSDLVDGVARIPAASGGSASVQQYRVEMVVSAPSTAVDRSLASCGAPGAGYGNRVTLLAGATELGRATACADIALPHLQFTKTASTPQGTGPGATITYTITATNTGDGDFSAADPAMIIDDMSGLLDDASYADDARADAGTLAAAAPRLGWSGPLAAGATVTIGYTAVVNRTGTGDGELVNTASLLTAAAPVGDLPACADTVTGNADVASCAVSLAVESATDDPGDPNDPDDSDDPGDPDRSDLAYTGADPLLLVGAALLVMLSGAGLVALRRRTP